MRLPSAISPTDCAAAGRSCSHGRATSACCRLPNAPRCSNCWPAAASTSARLTVDSAPGPGSPSAISRPRPASSRTDLPPSTCWSGCAGGKFANREPWRLSSSCHHWRAIEQGGSARRPRPSPNAVEGRSRQRVATMANGTIRRLISALLGLATVAAPFAVLLTFMAPAGAQFFDGRFPFLQDRFWRPRPPTYHPDAQRGPPPDNSKAPPAKKAEVEPLTSVLVVGDSLADWLAHGLETAFSDSPEMGVVRKHRTG